VGYVLHTKSSSGNLTRRYHIGDRDASIRIIKKLRPKIGREVVDWNQMTRCVMEGRVLVSMIMNI